MTPTPANPYSEFISDFIEAMGSTRGPSLSTIRRYSSRAGVFLKWMGSRNETLSSVSLPDADDFLAVKAVDGWRPMTLASQCQSLRAFIARAATRGWCPRGIGQGISSPASLRTGDENCWEKNLKLLGHSAQQPSTWCGRSEQIRSQDRQASSSTMSISMRSY